MHRSTPRYTIGLLLASPCVADGHRRRRRRQAELESLAAGGLARGVTRHVTTTVVSGSGPHNGSCTAFVSGSRRRSMHDYYSERWMRMHDTIEGLSGHRLGKAKPSCISILRCVAVAVASAATTTRPSSWLARIALRKCMQMHANVAGFSLDTAGRC